MEYDNVCELIAAAKPTEQVEQALNGNLEKAGIITPQCPDALVASKLFNVATAAMDVLRKDPSNPLTEEKIKHLDYEDWLAKFTLNLFDYARDRNLNKGRINFASSAAKKIGSCLLVEDSFSTIGQPEYDDEGNEIKRKLYALRNGDPILYKRGDNHALSLKSSAINNVRYPAGTLFNVVDNEGFNKNDTIDDLEVAPILYNSIKSIVPIRFTLLAFKPEDRSAILEREDEYEANLIDDEMLLNFQLFEITNSLPSRNQISAATKAAVSRYAYN